MVSTASRRALSRAGLDDREAVSAFFAVYDFMVGHAAVRAGRGKAERGRPERNRIVRERVGRDDYEARFEQGLEILLAGISVRCGSHVASMGV